MNVSHPYFVRQNTECVAKVYFFLNPPFCDFT